MKQKQGKFGGKYRQKTSCRKFMFKKLAVIPGNLKAANCSALPYGNNEFTIVNIHTLFSQYQE
jgi:hypothetical protein